jgi:hypothetical protein
MWFTIHNRKSSDVDPGSQTYEDPSVSGCYSDISHKKLNFYMINILKVDDRSKKHSRT